MRHTQLQLLQDKKHLLIKSDGTAGGAELIDYDAFETSHSHWRCIRVIPLQYMIDALN